MSHMDVWVKTVPSGEGSNKQVQSKLALRHMSGHYGLQYLQHECGLFNIGSKFEYWQVSNSRNIVFS
jgi:hypothetical protein